MAGLNVTFSRGWTGCGSKPAADASRNFSPLPVTTVQAEVTEQLHRAPRLFGLVRSRWWLAGLRQSVSAFASLSLSAICKWLQRWHLRYKRGRQTLHSPDPDYNLKLSYLQAARHQAQQQPGKVVFLYMDEFTYYRRPSLARAYACQGHHQAGVAGGYRTNRHRRIASCLNALNGATFSWQRTSFKVTTLLRFYRAVEAAYPDAQRIFIALDNWSPHFHPDILLALQSSRITLLRLPTYAPWTNPVEKVWLRLNQELLHLHPFTDDWQGLQTAVQQWLDTWQQPSPDLLHSVGLSP